MSPATIGDDNFSFGLPESAKPDMDSVVAIGLPKSGSTLLMLMLEDICDALGHTVVNFPKFCFDNGVDLNRLPATTSELFQPKGYCYLGFRNVPTNFEIPILEDCKSILLIRDPRDCVASLYYSLAYSHSIPAVETEFTKRRIAQRDKVRAQDINEFAKLQMPIYAHYLRLCKALHQKHPNMLVMYYEENVYMKYRMVKRILNQFGWTLPDDTIVQIASKHDVRPEAEDKHKHIRQVHPGNYLTKLDRSTIKEINDEYRPLLRSFGYL